jgi:hypothetical protein
VFLCLHERRAGGLALLSGIRDVAIVVLALESIVIGLLLLLTLLQLRSLTRMLQEGLRPMLDSAQQTVNIVRGTTDFVSDTLVRPVIWLLSVFSGLKRAIGVVLGMLGLRG